MARMVFVSDAAKKAQLGAASLHRDAVGLRNRSVPIGCDNLMDFMNRMRETYMQGVEPLRLANIPDDPDKTDEEMTAARSALVNGLVAQLTLNGPTDTHERTVAMKDALGELFTAYNDNCFVQNDFAVFSVESGGSYSQVSDLSPLYPALDKLIEATSVYVD